jgi:hypothetical protein
MAGVASVGELIKQTSSAVSPLAGDKGLTGRMRGFAALMVFSIVVFTGRDLLAHPATLRWLLVMKGVQIGLAAGLYWAVRPRVAVRRPLAITFAFACLWCLTVAVSCILRGAAASTALSFAAVLLCTAGLVPWGGVAQAALSAVAVGLWVIATWTHAGSRALLDPMGVGLLGIAGIRRLCAAPHAVGDRRPDRGIGAQPRCSAGGGARAAPQ